MESTGHELPTWAPLPARADEGFDELAARVCAELRVQRALVVLVSKSGQVFPGAAGLPEPWETRRSMPLSHSMNLRVLSTGRPLVLRDAREDPQLRDSPGVLDMQIVAYAAMPLADVHGRPIGVLSVSDDQPRDWSARDLATLHGLAAEAARRLQFQALELAEREAVATAARAALAATRTADSARAAYVEAEAAADRARVVARLSQDLQPAETLLDVLRSIDRFVRSPLGASVALLGLAETGSTDLRVWAAVTGTPPTTRVATGLYLSDAHPLATAVRERRPVPVGSRAAGEAEFPALARFPVGAETALAAPVVLGQHTAAAGLLVGWGETRDLDAPLSAVVTDLARHVGHALDRVLLRAQRMRLGAASPPVSVSA
ncbi:GAF domain-containing protein [Modestobacter altitudinis]|uniref:GAF domain-containing protein n=1 Tax=Modestobacter altitudinis TaxID=2213158 RepID=UPI00110C9884|nr:GAF domain-containing protein [Modestobacter altitudinis]